MPRLSWLRGLTNFLKAKKPEVIKGNKFQKDKIFCRIIVGLDFGTSATKVIFRDLKEDIPHLVQFDHHGMEITGYPTFCEPSSIRIVNGKTYFGSDAEQRKGGYVFRSLKVCLACLYFKERICKDCEQSMGVSLQEKQGCFNLGRQRTSIHALCTLYLAYMLGIVSNKILKVYPLEEFQIMDKIINMAAPLDIVNKADINYEFQYALFIAEKLTNKITNGISVKKALKLYKSESKAHQRLDEPEKRKTFVIPETVAALNSYYLSPFKRSGLYCIVDIGAGTTDISFFRIHVWKKRGKDVDAPEQQDDKVSCYFHQARMIGCDDMDRAVLRKIGGHVELLEIIRRAKQKLAQESPVPITPTKTLSKKEFEECIAEVVEKIYSYYIDVWRKALSKELRQDHWKEYTLFLVGGGAGIPRIKGKFECLPPDWVKKVDVERFKLSTELVKHAKLTNEDQNLLVVANGLSFHRLNFPEFYWPDEIDPFPPPPDKSEIGREDLYAK